MKTLKILIVSLGVASLAGCGASSGPIKAYDASAVTDKSTIATIYLPPAIELIEVNGDKKLDTPFIEQGYNELQLLPGKHAIAVKYVQFWGDMASGSIVRSSVRLFDLEIKAGDKLYMNYKRPANESEVRDIVRSFKPWLENSKGDKLNVMGYKSHGRSLTSTDSMQQSKAIAAKEPLDELKFWWDKASGDAKNKFKKWLNEETY